MSSKESYTSPIIEIIEIETENILCLSGLGIEDFNSNGSIGDWNNFSPFNF